MANTIDRVNLVHNERLDKPDADRLQALVDTAVQRSFGGLMGHGSGATGPFVHTYNDGAATLSFGRFQYYLGDGNPNMIDPGTGNYKGWTGGFHEHNPASMGQPQAFSVAAAKAAAASANPPPAAALPYIYVQPTTAQVATEARNQWVAGAPTPVSMTTIIKVVHQFTFDTTPPDSKAGWACIGRISSWTAPGNPNPGSPVIEHISFLDNYNKALVNGLPAAMVGTSLAGMYPWMDGLNGDAVPALSPVVGTADAHKDVGLLQVLTAMRGQLARILDSTGGQPWWQNPNTSTAQPGGLKQLWSYVQTLFLFHDRTPIPWAMGHFSWDGAQYVMDVATARNLASASLIGGLAGNISVMLSTSPPANYSICHAQATAGLSAGGVGSVECCSVLTVLANEVRIRRFVSTTGVPTNGDFWVIVYAAKNP